VKRSFVHPFYEGEWFDNPIGESKIGGAESVVSRPESQRGLRILPELLYDSEIDCRRFGGFKSSSCYATYDRPAWCVDLVLQVLYVFL
jgi:hypothetical protein